MPAEVAVQKRMGVQTGTVLGLPLPGEMHRVDAQISSGWVTFCRKGYCMGSRAERRVSRAFCNYWPGLCMQQ